MQSWSISGCGGSKENYEKLGVPVEIRNTHILNTNQELPLEATSSALH
jgi:hypothetical protein